MKNLRKPSTPKQSSHAKWNAVYKSALLVHKDKPKEQLIIDLPPDNPNKRSLKSCYRFTRKEVEKRVFCFNVWPAGFRMKTPQYRSARMSRKSNLKMYRNTEKSMVLEPTTKKNKRDSNELTPW